MSNTILAFEDLPVNRKTVPICVMEVPICAERQKSISREADNVMIILSDKRGTSYIDTAVVILIAVVLGLCCSADCMPCSGVWCLP